jgi:cell shape-determining protein MreD
MAVGTWSAPLVRLVPIGLVMVAVQFAVADDMRLFSVVPQIALAFVAGTGAGAGSERGAYAGFILGLMMDLRGAEALGLTALAYGAAGLVAGYVLSITPDPQWWLSALFTAVGAAVGEVMVPTLKLMTGSDGWLTFRVAEVVAVVAAVAALLSPLFVPVGRWSMGVKRKKWRVIPE